MDPKERVRLIREGNAAFNAGDIRKARELFLKTGYKDGLIRMGDYFMYEKKLPLLAYGYYRKAGYSVKTNEIFQRMLYALSVWIGREKFKTPISPSSAPNLDSNQQGSNQPERKELNPDDFQVHPILRAKALEILEKHSKKNL